MSTSIWSENARSFATRPEQAATVLRRDGIRRTLDALTVHNDAELAYARLAASVEQQARILGLGRVHLLPCDNPLCCPDQLTA